MSDRALRVCWAGWYFFLDDADREAAQATRRSHNRLGYAVQLTSVRFLGRFMADPRQVPTEVAEYLAGQLDIEDASCLKLYGERDGTARTHAGEIQDAVGWHTPSHLRGRGYSAAAMAEASRIALTAGPQQVLLFTNLANPSSNAAVQRIGYRTVTTFALYDFVT